MSHDLTETEVSLMSASAEISTLLHWNSELFTPLTQAIEATGKSVDDLSVGELRQLINDGYNNFTSLCNAGGTA